MTETKIDIRKARQSGNSVVINVTDYAVPGQFFKVGKDGKKITMTEVEMTEA